MTGREALGQAESSIRTRSGDTIDEQRADVLRSLMLPVELEQRLAGLASSEDRTTNELIVDILADGISLRTEGRGSANAESGAAGTDAASADTEGFSPPRAGVASISTDSLLWDVGGVEQEAE